VHFDDGDNRFDVPGGYIRILPNADVPQDHDAKLAASDVKREEEEEEGGSLRDNERRPTGIKAVPAASTCQAEQLEDRAALPKDNKRKRTGVKAAPAASQSRVEREEERAPRTDDKADVAAVSWSRRVSTDGEPEKLSSMDGEGLDGAQMLSKTEFLSAPLFHLNPFLLSGELCRGFGPFISKEVATCGFDETNDPSVLNLVCDFANRKEVREAIVQYWKSKNSTESVRSAAQVGGC